MPDRDQVRALKLLTETLTLLRLLEADGVAEDEPTDRGFERKQARERTRELAEEIDGFLHHRSEGAA